MYVNPLTGDGLFAIDTAGDKSERDLPYEFDPSVDYFAKFDEFVPKWQAIGYEKVNGSLGAFSESVGPAEVKVAPRTTRVMPYMRYVRAIDPAGNVCPLSVSSVRPSPAFPDGHDKCGTLNRVIAEKNAAGWLIVENSQLMWSPYSGKAGQQYAAWALAVMKYRLVKHAEHEASEAKAFQSRAEKAANAQLAGMKEMGKEIAREMRAERVEQSTKPGRRAE